MLYMQNYSVCIQNCFLRCFNSGFLTNQVTNVLTEVIPFCKSGHIYLTFNFQDSVEKDDKNYCFICGIDNDTFERHQQAKVTIVKQLYRHYLFIYAFTL